MKPSKTLFAALAVSASGMFSPATANQPYDQALHKAVQFFDAQRADGGSTAWRLPAASNDGADVGLNLAGGWFDAGDHIKFGLPMAYSASMLGWGLLEYPDGHAAAGSRALTLDNLNNVYDYLLAAWQPGNPDSTADDRLVYQVGDGDADHAYWGAPENMTMARPARVCTATARCSEVAAQTAAALAIGSLLVADDLARADRLLGAAEQLYRFANERQGNNGYDSQGYYDSFSGWRDELAWAATWLYLATSDNSYLQAARQHAQGMGIWEGHTWDNVGLGTELLIGREVGGSHRQRAEDLLDNWVLGSGSVQYSNGGLAFLLRWGSLRYSTTAAFLALVAADMQEDATTQNFYQDFAQQQLDYALGDNPLGMSFMVGHGENFPLRPHHRAAHDSSQQDIRYPDLNSHQLTGALVGGPMSRDDFDWQDTRLGEAGYVGNEVATDYNAGFSSALAAMAQRTKLVELPEAVLAGPEAAAETFTVTLAAQSTADSHTAANVPKPRRRDKPPAFSRKRTILSGGSQQPATFSGWLAASMVK